MPLNDINRKSRRERLMVTTWKWNSKDFKDRWPNLYQDLMLFENQNCFVYRTEFSVVAGFNFAAIGELFFSLDTMMTIFTEDYAIDLYEWLLENVAEYTETYASKEML